MKKFLSAKSTLLTANRTTTQTPASPPSSLPTKIIALPNSNASVVIKSSPPDNSTYQQRKIMQPAYQELFRALLRLPDKDVQKRVMDAINGVATPPAADQFCVQCQLRRQRRYATSFTQTMRTPNAVTHANVKRELNSNSTTSDDETPATAAAAAAATLTASETVPLKKRRKRKVCLPQVVKRSHAQAQAHAQSQLQAKIKKRKVEVEPEKPKETATPVVNNNLMKRHRSDSMCSSIITMDQLDYIAKEFTTLTPLEQMKLTMAQEYLDSGEFENGFLPIHNAIIMHSMDALRRQIFVWTKMKKLDLNELLTDEDEDCLQLAVVHDCDADIIGTLLDAGLITNSVDAQSNTIIHLALLNKIKLDSFGFLLKRIELSLLLQLNDDGHTPLHIAVRQDLFAHAEILLNVLDERLGGAVTYKRNSSINSFSEMPKKADFLKYYQNECSNLNANVYAPIYAQLQLKRRLLECGERRSGNTALFVAIENQMEHFIYFLLAHFSDPRVRNHGGQDAKSYFNEFSKVLNLSLKIDQTMEKVINAD